MRHCGRANDSFRYVHYRDSPNHLGDLNESNLVCVIPCIARDGAGQTMRRLLVLTMSTLDRYSQSRK